jgi:hypothetical protein
MIVPWSLPRAAYSLLPNTPWVNAGNAGPHLDEAITLLDELADSELASRLDAAFYLGWAEFLTERFDDAVRHLERGIAVSRATGQGHLSCP